MNIEHLFFAGILGIGVILKIVFGSRGWGLLGSFFIGMAVGHLIVAGLL